MGKEKILIRKQSGIGAKMYLQQPTQAANVNVIEGQPKHRITQSYVSFPDYIHKSLKQQKDHVVRNIPKIHRPIQTIYQLDFVERDPMLNDLSPSKIFKSEMKTEGRIEIISTNQHDFVPLRSTSVKGTRVGMMEQTRSSYTPFQGNSNYAQNFIKWKVAGFIVFLINRHSDIEVLIQNIIIRPNIRITVIKNAPFLGKSLYKETFQGLSSEPVISFKGNYINKRSPLVPTNIPICSETSSGQAYRAFDMNQNDRYTRNFTSTKNLEFYTKPSFAGQYRTSYRNDFTDKIKEENEIQQRNGLFYDY